MEIKLTEVVDKILGQYSAYGSHHEDLKALDNLIEVEKLLKHIIDRLCKNVQTGKESVAYSVVCTGNKSKDILDEIQELINENQKLNTSCEYCKGTGKIKVWNNNIECNYCGGSGYAPKECDLERN